MRSTQLPTILGSLSAFLVINSSLSQAQQVPPSLTPGLPHQKLNVQRQSGTCPQTVGLWTILVGYEGERIVQCWLIRDRSPDLPTTYHPAKSLSSTKHRYREPMLLAGSLLL